MWCRRIAQIWAVILFGIFLAGCVTAGEGVANSTIGEENAAAPAFPEVTSTVQDASDVKYFPSDEPLRLALEHFNRGHYGLAERYFQDAVEKTPKDATAWVGLAASYDRLSRFDLADRAYASAVKLVGETTEILNNEGYSYILRGDLVRARKKLLQAQAREPNNATVINNLQLLNGSYRYVRREGDLKTN